MSTPVRFIHAADLHLDAPFGGVDATDARVRDALGASTYKALEAIVDACLEYAVDFLVVAGDVYNHRERGVRSQLAFARAASRLNDADIPVYVVHGNHDPASGWSAGIALPENVQVFGADGVERLTFERAGEVACALYGRSFRTAAEHENFAREYARDDSDPIAIGVLHGNVGGRPEYDDYAPCSLADLRAARMDYWALGHIHKPEVISEDPYAVYAGCPQGLDPTQSGPRGCWLVTAGPGTAAAEFLPVASIVWDFAQVDVSEVASLDDVRAALLSAVDSARDGGDTTPVVLRADLLGRTEAHGALSSPGALDALVEDVRSEALLSEQWVWLDRVRDRTGQVLDLNALRATEDFGGDVVRLADHLLADDVAAAAFVADVADPLMERVRDAAPAPDAADVIARARDLVLDRLFGEAAR
jgi:DNA repair exonuclease SbcCD nuclease subunit